MAPVPGNLGIVLVVGLRDKQPTLIHVVYCYVTCYLAAEIAVAGAWVGAALRNCFATILLSSRAVSLRSFDFLLFWPLFRPSDPIERTVGALLLQALRLLRSASNLLHLFRTRNVLEFRTRTSSVVRFVISCDASSPARPILFQEASVNSQ